MDPLAQKWDCNHFSKCLGCMLERQKMSRGYAAHNRLSTDPGNPVVFRRARHAFSELTVTGRTADSLLASIAPSMGRSDSDLATGRIAQDSTGPRHPPERKMHRNDYTGRTASRSQFSNRRPVCCSARTSVLRMRDNLYLSSNPASLALPILFVLKNSFCATLANLSEV